MAIDVDGPDARHQNRRQDAVEPMKNNKYPGPCGIIREVRKLLPEDWIDAFSGAFFQLMCRQVDTGN